MIGIVLWSDPSESKAVFWCEDQGDLAYYEGCAVSDAPCLHAGDMVQFEVSAEASTRLAHAPRLLQEQVHPDLPGQLRRTAESVNDAVPCTATIIPFAGAASRQSDKTRWAAKA